ncbi:hypothetical protein FQN54_007505 [Arachnomyces sp. PD_36]|nr:hypothetical protein FQN54_007505 [Arachnomyces sp. PD_36]
MGTPVQGDPFDWTVNQVVSYICHGSPDAWSKSSAPTARPDPVAFGKALQENDVNGEILLTEITKNTLQQELGVKSLGQRSNIFNAVVQLRQQSIKYQQHLATSQPPAPTQSPWPLHLPQGSNSPVVSHTGYYGQSSCSSPQVQNPSYVHGPILSSSTIATSPFRPTDQPIQLYSPSELSRTNNAAPTPDSGHQHTEPNDAGPMRRVPADTTQALDLPTDSGEQSHPTQHEHHIIDERGRKRRRLNLGTPVPIKAIQRPYMGRAKVPTIDIFYKPHPQDNDEDNFLITKSDIPTGERLYVNKRMRHYFKQQPFYLGMKGRKQILGVAPYPEEFVQPGDPHYFTLFTPRDRIVDVTQERVDQWPELRGEQSNNSNDRDVSLPPLGDSGSEGEYDSDTWNEMEAEKEMKNRAAENQNQSGGEPKYLSVSEINTTIDACLDTFSKDWDSKKFPVEDRKAWRLWKLSGEQKNRKRQISDAQILVERLQGRLERIRGRILDEKWTKVSELQAQCQCMEPSMSDIKKAKWKISVLELSSCPQKPPRDKSLPKRVKKPAELYQKDEESLDSDIDSGSDDDMEDFIHPDEGTAAGAVDEMDTTLPDGDVEDKQAVLKTSPSSSESEEDIVGPVPPRRRRRGPIRSRSVTTRGDSAAEPSQTPKTPQKPRAKGPMRTPVHVRLLQEDVDVVDLTQIEDSPVKGKTDDRMEESGDIVTPPLNPTGPPEYGSTPHPGESQQLSQSPISINGENAKQESSKPENQAAQPPELPDVGDFQAINQLSYSFLEERQDRQRLLSKAIVGIPDKDRKELHLALKKTPVERLRKHVILALDSLLQHKQALKDLPDDRNAVVMRMSALYISWIKCKHLGKTGIPKAYISEAKAQIKEFDSFHQSLSEVLVEYFTSFDTSNDQEVDDDPGSDVIVTGSKTSTSSTPRKRRKKAVKQSRESINTQKSAQHRVEVQKQQQSRLAKTMESMGVSNDDPERQAVSFENHTIYLNAHIGRRVKPHQLNGIQFMWREIMTDDKGTGCLLAHTMGLGKTMQVISLLVTMANAGASMDPEIRNQVPKRLRETRALILCPSSLIDNWVEEFVMWTPPSSSTRENIGEVRKVVSQGMSAPQRLSEISAWHHNGGVLIISYEMFRNLIFNTPTQLIADHERVQKQLLEGPSLIVADEAHKMKNEKSKIAAATARFKSKSRIALTGSPLANNLTEYYAMINWISPGYLGKFVEFKANYIEPIELGLYLDSTPAERRRSLKKLQVLTEDLNPKVNRADISAIQSDLPPKVEFVITVPLTDIQEKCYNLYVDSLFGHSDAPIGNARLWDWLSILSLCCTHPWCFQYKLRGREIPNNEQKGRQGPSSPEDTELEGARDNIPETVVKEQLRMLQGMTESDKHSYRTTIVTQIIDESIKVGDKVLIFSHNLVTLDFMERALQQIAVAYKRLDGKTPVATRQASTKEFNKADSNFYVYLISTRAGGLGLNIPGANRVIILDFSFNPSNEEQAVGRAYRLGQKKPVFIYRFMSGGTFEEIIYNKAVFKTQLSSRVVDKKNPIRCAYKSPKDYLFHVKKTEQTDLSEFKGKDVLVLDKILAQENPIKVIGLTETFHRESNDRLTEEEKKEAEAELADERLRRSDPQAWERKKAWEHQQLYQIPSQVAAQMPMGPYQGYHKVNNNHSSSFIPQPPPPGHVMGGPSVQRPFNNTPMAPLIGHPIPPHTVTPQGNGGPPPLPPDTSMFHSLPIRDSPQENTTTTLTPASKGLGIQSNHGKQTDGTTESNPNDSSNQESKPQNGESKGKSHCTTQ